MVSGGPIPAPARAGPEDILPLTAGGDAADTPHPALRERILHQAIWGLALGWPACSAAHRVTAGQQRAFGAGAAALAGFALLAPDLALGAAMALMNAAFLSLVAFRLLAAVLPPPRPDRTVPSDAELPVYTIIAPLYREARVAERLIRSLAALDYPRARLDILLVVEEDDAETAGAVRRAAPAHMRVVEVPGRQPRTKPKALTYAMAFARGALLTIYDAEDRPHPAQLRAAAAAFARDPRLACVQAPLTYYNAKENSLTRCFQLEYAIHFRVILPALVRLGMPIPLGGTSNHFRFDVLRAAGGWDPYNVTEDADLGFRLAARGGRMGVIDPPTLEEATCRLRPWIRQRSRWLKGYAQTILVHTRQPVGPRAALALWLTLGGALAAALLHGPALALFLGGLAYGWLTGSGPEWAVILVFLAGYVSTACAAVTAALRARDPSLLAALPRTPFYWPLQSWAACIALRQFVTDPFRWEKTDHGVSRMPRGD